MGLSLMYTFSACTRMGTPCLYVFSRIAENVEDSEGRFVIGTSIVMV